MTLKQFARQACLAEVGLEGQQRIAHSRVTVASGSPLARGTAERYLAGAGVAVAPRGPASANTAPIKVHCAPLPMALARGPREIAEGAMAALRALRCVLAVGALDDPFLVTSGAPSPTDDAPAKPRDSPR